jgi:hypothetical protein
VENVLPGVVGALTGLAGVLLGTLADRARRDPVGRAPARAAYRGRALTAHRAGSRILRAPAGGAAPPRRARPAVVTR